MQVLFTFTVSVVFVAVVLSHRDVYIYIYMHIYIHIYCMNMQRSAWSLVEFLSWRPKHVDVDLSYRPSRFRATVASATRDYVGFGLSDEFGLVTKWVLSSTKGPYGNLWCPRYATRLGSPMCNSPA